MGTLLSINSVNWKVRTNPSVRPSFLRGSFFCPKSWNASASQNFVGRFVLHNRSCVTTCAIIQQLSWQHSYDNLRCAVHDARVCWHVHVLLLFTFSWTLRISERSCQKSFSALPRTGNSYYILPINYFRDLVPSVNVDKLWIKF